MKKTNWKVAVWNYKSESDSENPIFYVSFNPEKVDEIAQYVLSGSDLAISASRQPQGSPCNKDDPAPQPRDDLLEYESLRIKKDDTLNIIRCSKHDRQVSISGNGSSIVEFFNRVKETNRTGLENTIECEDKYGRNREIEILFGCPDGFVLAY
ncbi:hypothetical protein [Cerasicoccus maritimus]|uniref:hypothetical protein n=1 Tax=Cerasicoccus maritimus TaxID=490089 RepID=UPI0028525F76|nr:hypothetical protein [Cerasicoccus maritimus]